MDWPLVSVIVPARNAEQFIAEALQSIVDQDYDSLDVIVIDGGSTDSTRAIAESFGTVRCIPQEGTGIPDAWNLGIDAARGDFLAFLSADDRWTEDKLARQVKYMLDRPSLLYTITKFRYFLGPDGVIPRSFNPKLLNRVLVGRIMETLLARRAAFEIVGRLDTSLSLPHDVDWYARAKDLDIPMAILDEVLRFKRIHSGNASADAELNTPALLEVLHRSVRRQRANAPGATKPASDV